MTMISSQPITRPFRLFLSWTEGVGRVGLQPEAIARLTVLARIDQSMRDQLAAEGLTEHQFSIDKVGVWTRERVFFESTQSMESVRIVPEEGNALRIFHKSWPNRSICVQLDDQDAQDVMITLPRAELLRDGETIQAGDIHIPAASAPAQMVPDAWVGQRFVAGEHRRIRRPVAPVVRPVELNS